MCAVFAQRVFDQLSGDGWGGDVRGRTGGKERVDRDGEEREERGDGGKRSEAMCC